MDDDGADWQCSCPNTAPTSEGKLPLFYFPSPKGCQYGLRPQGLSLPGAALGPLHPHKDTNSVKWLRRGSALPQGQVDGWRTGRQLQPGRSLLTTMLRSSLTATRALARHPVP